MMALWMRRRVKTMTTMTNNPHATKMNETKKELKINPNQHYSINRVTLVTQ